MLEAHDLGFSYGSKQILSHFDLTVAPGERVAVSAPSGRGRLRCARCLRATSALSKEA